jgi:redox-sensitive bicupin YhaK (pirin superfamily)
VTINDGEQAGEAEVVRFERDGGAVNLRADGDAMLLVLSGAPLDEPVVGYGPFVMNSEAEIRAAIDDFNRGRFLSRGPDAVPAPSPAPR